MLTAAPIIRKPMSLIGAPGLTDFVKIYIASELNKREYRTTLRHEQAHVWAGHNRRRPKDSVDKLWRIACEMEIAKTIYDNIDIENINAPRSRLSGGYLPDTLANMPLDILLAEDIYEWLLQQPEDKIPDVECTCSCTCNSDLEEEADQLDASRVVESARAALDEIDQVGEAQAAVTSNYNHLKNRTPSLTDEVDAALRVRVERERTHRRPSRRDSPDVILPGAVSIPRPPLVEIFVDRSGSFSPDKTAQAEIRLKKILAKYGASIVADVWFFGNGRISARDVQGGGDTPYHLIAQHLAGSLPKVAIIITDDDPVESSIKPVLGPIIMCVPVGCTSTNLAHRLGGKDVS